MAKLTINEAANGFTHKFAFDYQDLLNAAATVPFLPNNSNTARVVGTLPAGGIIDRAAVFMVSSANITTSTIDFGTQTNDPDELIDADTLGLMSTLKCFVNTGDQLTSSAKELVINNTSAAKSLTMEINTISTALTSGSWVLAWRQYDPLSV